jgi:predicted PurR-regulated permease PerM
MIVIFTGFIGGTLSNGLLGVFIGPTVMAVFYDLIMNRVSSAETTDGEQSDTETSD